MPVHMVAPAHRPMPDVKRFSSRRMEIPSTRDALEMKLMDWIQQVLDYISQSAAMDGVHPATYLTANADGIDTIMHAPTAMNLGPRTVYADFAWGRRPNGNWYIRHVKFGLHLGQAQLTEADRRALKDRLIDQAETENATHYHARQVVFPAENYIRTWHDEITRGNNHLKYLIEEIYEAAKEEASMPENWITPQDMAVSFGGDAVAVAKGGTKIIKGFDKAAEEGREISALTGGVEASKAYGETLVKVGRVEEGEKLVRDAERTGKYIQTYEDIEKAKRKMEGIEYFKRYKELDEQEKELAEREDKPVFQKSRADFYADLGLEVVSSIPGVGGFVKMFAGMFIDIGLANYAGVVAGIRARIYSCFVGGFVTGLTGLGDANLKLKRDRKYYDLGVKRGVGIPPMVSFQYQIALMYYAMTHYTSGFWAGTTSEFHGRQDSEWDYPDEWEAKWSPELLGRSLVTLLGFKHYLIE
jgi:hypothetical protein